MAERIVVFGATGYTGDLTARALVARGARPVLAARNEARVRALAEELGGLEWAVADVARPDTRARAASSAATCSSRPSGRSRAGASRRCRPRSARARTTSTRPARAASSATSSSATARARRPPACGLVTAFGYDWVPGNLAGALALRDAGEAATSVQIGYFNPGDGRRVDERRHARERGRRDALARLRLARRAPRRRARGAPRARVRDLPRQAARARSASPRPSTSRCRACTPACATSTSSWAGSARPREPMRVVSAGMSARDEGPRRARRARRALRPPRQGLDRRPRRRGARDRARRWCSPRPATPAGTRARRRAPGGRQRLRPHRALPGLGRADRRRAAACRAPARWGRSTASGSTRWRPGARRRGSRGSRRSAARARRLRRCAPSIEGG